MSVSKNVSVNYLIPNSFLLNGRGIRSKDEVVIYRSYAVEFLLFLFNRRVSQSKPQRYILKLCDLCGNSAPFAVYFSDKEKFDCVTPNLFEN